MGEKRESVTVSVTCKQRAASSIRLPTPALQVASSIVALLVTLERLLVLRSYPRIFDDMIMKTNVGP